MPKLKRLDVEKSEMAIVQTCKKKHLPWLYAYMCDGAGCDRLRVVKTATDIEDLNKKLPKGWLQQVEYQLTKTGRRSKSLIGHFYCPACKAKAMKSEFYCSFVKRKTGRYIGK